MTSKMYPTKFPIGQRVRIHRLNEDAYASEVVNSEGWISRIELVDGKIVYRVEFYTPINRRDWFPFYEEELTPIEDEKLTRKLQLLKPYDVLSVTRSDVMEHVGCTEEEALTLTENDMHQIADRLKGYLIDNGLDYPTDVRDAVSVVRPDLLLRRNAVDLAIQEGDRVRVTKNINYGMLNPDVVKLHGWEVWHNDVFIREGETGTVTEVQESNEYTLNLTHLFSLDESGDDWWVDPRWLEKI